MAVVEVRFRDVQRLVVGGASRHESTSPPSTQLVFFFRARSMP